jgi:hypothetical protein
MKERHSGHQTQWAAQFAVASELCRRNYRVSLAHGNEPGFDLMVISPAGQRFEVDVKGLYRPNYWQVRKKEQRGKVYYVFAYVPDAGPSRAKPNRFFVLDQATINKLIDEHRAECPPSEKYREGVPWRWAEEHEEAWSILPA